MTIRQVSPTSGKIYSPHSELGWSSKHLLSCFYILGLNEEDMNTYTIDDLIDRCGWMFEPHPMEPYLPVGDKQRSCDPGFSFGRKQKSWMMLLSRRFWRRRHISSFEVENNV